METLIEVTVIDSGDVATAATPEAALLAARTMGREARDAVGIQGFDPRIVFRVEGTIVRATTLRTLNREVQ